MLSLGYPYLHRYALTGWMIRLAADVSSEMVWVQTRHLAKLMFGCRFLDGMDENHCLNLSCSKHYRATDTDDENEDLEHKWLEIRTGFCSSRWPEQDLELRTMWICDYCLFMRDSTMFTPWSVFKSNAQHQSSTWDEVFSHQFEQNADHISS